MPRIPMRERPANRQDAAAALSVHRGFGASGFGAGWEDPANAPCCVPAAPLLRRVPAARIAPYAGVARVSAMEIGLRSVPNDVDLLSVDSVG